MRAKRGIRPPHLNPLGFSGVLHDEILHLAGIVETCSTFLSDYTLGAQASALRIGGSPSTGRPNGSTWHRIAPAPHGNAWYTR